MDDKHDQPDPARTEDSESIKALSEYWELERRRSVRKTILTTWIAILFTLATVILYSYFHGLDAKKLYTYSTSELFIYLTIPVLFFTGVFILLSTGLRRVASIDNREVKAERKLEQVEQEVFQPSTWLTFEERVALAAKQKPSPLKPKPAATQTDNRRPQAEQSAQTMPEAGSLLRLYSAQIEKYQSQSMSRAGSSFFFALVAMFAGLTLIGIGVYKLFQATDWTTATGGSVITVVGAALSAFLSKTFLSIHKTSLEQLGNYYNQPVVNEHLILAERAAGLLPPGEERNKAYQQIVTSLLTRITVAPKSEGEEKKS